MTSLLRSTRQTSSDAQNFVVIGGNANANGVLVWNQDTTGNGANVTGNFTTLSSFVGVTPSSYPLLTGLGALSSFSTVGTIYKDMGVTIVSSGLTFRKLQFTLPGSAGTDVNANLTNGVSNGGNGSAGGVAQSGVYPGFLTCYVQLGRNGGTAGLNLARV